METNTWKNAWIILNGYEAAENFLNDLNEIVNCPPFDEMEEEDVSVEYFQLFLGFLLELTYGSDKSYYSYGSMKQYFSHTFNILQGFSCCFYIWNN